MNRQKINLKNCTFLLKDGTHGTHKDVESGKFLLSAKNIVGGKVLIDSNPRIISNDDFGKIHSQYKIQNNDIVLTIVGTLGETAIVKEYNEEFTFQRSVAIIRFNPSIMDYRFGYYQLLSDNFQKELKKRESKGAQGGVYLGELGKIEILCPDLGTQEKIVAILEKWDAAIENLKQQILEEEKVFNILKYNLFYGKNKLLKPEKWTKIKLSDVAEFVNGYTFKSQSYCANGKYRVITIANVQEGAMNLDKINTIDKLPQNIKKEQILEVNDILVSMTGNVGRVCRVNDICCLLNQRVGKIVPTKIDASWLYYRLNTNEFITKMKDSAQGGAQDNISMKDIMNFAFLVPTPLEQVLTVNILHNQEDKISLLRQKLSNYESQRKYLLNRLLSGKEDI